VIRNAKSRVKVTRLENWFLGVLLPGSKVACAIGRGTDWDARSIIQEVCCGKDGRN
jgi:hypothetical protein